MKQDEKDKIVNRPVMAKSGIKTFPGEIKGRFLEFPRFVSGEITVEISWNLAKRAVEGSVILL